MAVTKIGQYAFYKHPNIETIRTSATTIEQYACEQASKLETVELTNTNACTINNAAFANTSLKHLIIRSSSLSTLSNANALNYTRIYSKKGTIYVPSALVNNYKSASNWANYASSIFSIDAYPRDDFSTTNDSWSTIIANANYASDYPLNTLKQINLSNGDKVLMQLIAINTDIKSSDHTSTARMTWLTDGIYYTHNINSTNTTTGAWPASAMRNWLRTDIFSLFPAELKTAIVEVDKTYVNRPSGTATYETLTTADTIWIPSMREVGYGETNTNKATSENAGVAYSNRFASNSNGDRTMRKSVDNAANEWWTRTGFNSVNFMAIGPSGSYSTYGSSASTAYGVVFGFCI